MKKLIVVIVAALLAGCAAHMPPLDRPIPPLTTGPLTPKEWVHASAYSIQSKFYDVDVYRGRKCELTLNIANDGTVQAAHVDGGDMGLCEAAIAAIKQAIFPPLPEGMPNEIPLMFEPK